MKSTNLEIDSMSSLSWQFFHIRSFVIESLLVVGFSAFWLVTLPFMAAASIAVKVWDAVPFRASPLFLGPELRSSRVIIHGKVSVPVPDLRCLRIKSRCLSGP
jgi:hypothetical protein